MVIRLLRTLGVMAVVATGGVLVSCWIQWSRPEEPVVPLVARGESTGSQEAAETCSQERVSPLVAAAQGLRACVRSPFSQV